MKQDWLLLTAPQLAFDSSSRTRLWHLKLLRPVKYYTDLLGWARPEFAIFAQGSHLPSDGGGTQVDAETAASPRATQAASSQEGLIAVTKL